jgi:hypothetical protein
VGTKIGFLVGIAPSPVPSGVGLLVVGFLVGMGLIGTHPDCLSFTLYPLRQVRHSDDLFSEYLSGGHLKQTSDLNGEYSPAGQSMQYR